MGSSVARMVDRPHALDQLPLPVPTFVIAPSVFLRSGIERYLPEERFQVVASVASFEGMAGNVPTDGEGLLFVDGDGDHAAALKNLQAFKVANKGVRAVVLVERYEREKLLAAYEAGVDGYLTTSVSEEALGSYLALVMLGERVVSSSAIAIMKKPAPIAEVTDAEPWDGVDRRAQRGLSIREASILRCLMDGHSNKVIAQKCGLAEATVKVHVKAICRKINVTNRTQAALWATAHLGRVERRSGG